MPPPGFLPTPFSTTPSTPVGPLTPLRRSSPDRELKLPDREPKIAPTVQPYICHAFKIQDSVLYLSDVSHIPDESWALLEGPALEGEGKPRYAAVIMDCLRPMSHISHFGIREAVNAARRLGARRTYLTGFGHEVSHDEYAKVGRIVGGEQFAAESLSKGEQKCVGLLEEGEHIWVRPAHDGLQLLVSSDNMIIDNTYDSV